MSSTSFLMASTSMGFRPICFLGVGFSFSGILTPNSRSFLTRVTTAGFASPVVDSKSA